MSERNLPPDELEILAAVAARTARCGDDGTLLAYAAQELPGDERASVALHLERCSTCGERLHRLTAAPAVDELTWRRAARRLDERPAPWRRSAGHFRWSTTTGWAAAAVLALAATSTGLLLRRAPVEPTPAPIAATHRGESLPTGNPRGPIHRLERFEWVALPLDVHYQLEVRSADGVVWAGAAGEPPWRPPRELIDALEPGAEYAWRVRGVDSAGTERLRSAWSDFVLQLPDGRAGAD